MEFYFAAFLFVVFAGGQALPDPCQPGNYVELKERHRSTAYIMNNQEQGLCDAALAPGWYRFVSPAGGMLTEQCPKQGQCGTVIPIWMNQSHPSVSEGEVSRHACAFFGNNGPGTAPCCDITVKIGVKNCGQYFVYFLQPPPSCPVAYCAGNKVTCPAGQWAPAGSSNCIDVYPIVSVDPTLTGPEIRGSAFRFSCHINYPATDPNLVFEVQWTFDGQPDPKFPMVTVTGSGRVTVLPGSLLQGHLDRDLACKVRAYYKNRPVVEKSPWRESNSYFAGFRVDPTHAVVSEKGGNATVTITSTIPILCAHHFQGACCLYFMLNVHGSRNNVQTRNHICSYPLCTKDWNPSTHTASTSVTLEATKDGIPDGDKLMFLDFEPLKTVGGLYMDVFTNYTLPQVQVVAKDGSTHKCLWRTDPHFFGFGGTSFDLYSIGDFTVYENTADDVEVQTRTIACGSSLVSCQCGVAIREGRDVIRISNCAHLGHAPVVETNRHPLSPGTVIERSCDGKNILVHLPSGRELSVDISGGYHSTTLTVPASDDGKGRGICGTLDSKLNNEFTHRNGYVDTKACMIGFICIPKAFLESWRNTYNSSLFYNQLPPTSTQGNGGKPPHNCQCDGTAVDHHINCTVPKPSHALHCSGVCHPIQPQVSPWMNQTWGPGRRDLTTTGLYLDIDTPDPAVNFTQTSPSDWNRTWPTPSGITESQARAKCLAEIQRSQLYARCHHMTSVTDFGMHSCVTDVLYSDNFDMTEANVAGFTAECQFEMTQDIRNYITDAHGNLVLHTDVTEVCSTTCFRHGRCVRGTCVCEAGYAGGNCQLIAGRGPHLSQIRGSSVCDINQRPCRKIFIDADHFEMSDLFKCRVQEYLPGGSLSNNTVEEKAEFITNARLACPLPDPRLRGDRSMVKFAVSVTHDGHLYSNALSLTVYDSTCLSCSDDGCMPKAGTCLIDNVCYQDGDVNSDDVTKSCRSSVSSSQWTLAGHQSGSHSVIDSPTLTGAGDILTCTIYTATHGASTRFEVTWLVNREPLGDRKTILANQQRHAYISRHELPPGAKSVQCQVRSFYAGSEESEFSAYLQSAVLVL